ncbi:Non-repetitive/WGA-negative nucleoporin C-terminal-domain-containing protein [Cryomyces antarcticus]
MASFETQVTSLQSTSTRNPRRRQRNDSDSLRQQPQRKRSKLSNDTFTAPSDARTNGNVTDGLNGHAGQRVRQHSTSPRSQILPVREKKQLQKRGFKGDGSAVLTENANYAVKHLPSLPERADAHLDFRGITLPSTNYALALTHGHAVVWDYTLPTAAPTTRTFPIPYLPKAGDPLPLGSLVTTRSSSEIGLVVISPTSGKITFWENVDSAETLNLFQQRRNGVEGSVGSLLSGETVVNIVNAEHAGFILTFSSGRLAQLTVRDTQGRPHINVQHLRTQGNDGSGGLFGGLKTVFGGGSWKRSVAAVKTRFSGTRGQMHVVSVTETGMFQLWDIDWSGQPAFRGSVEAHDDILNGVRATAGHEIRSQKESLKVLDCAIVPGAGPRGTEVSTLHSHHGVDFLVLVEVGDTSGLRHVLVELTLASDVAQVQRVLPLHTHVAPSTLRSQWKPSLLLPKPGHTAFIVFEQGIVLLSVTRRNDSPEAQLFMENHKLPEPFQDVVRFRKDKVIGIGGCGEEEFNDKSRQSGCIVFIKGYGIVRITAHEPSDNNQAVERSRIPVKSKMEQAVFYGSMPENILDFSKVSEIGYSEEEIDEAARTISDEVLNSDTAFISTIAPSMEHQLSTRAKALHCLAVHMKQNYPPLPRLTKWKMMWNAEKLAAARVVWQTYEAREKSSSTTQRPLLAEVVGMLHERFKTESTTELDDLDPVRRWFVKDVSRMEFLVPWGFNTIKELYREGIKSREAIMQIVSEADDLLLNIMETVYAFRAESVDLYGLGSESLSDGILTSGHEGLPEFWTSRYNIMVATKDLVVLAREAADKYYEAEGDGAPSTGLVNKIAVENTAMVSVCCTIYIERYRWSMAQKDEQPRVYGQNLKEVFERVRYDLIRGLAKIGQAYSGMELAEKYGDMRTLVDLVTAESAYLVEHLDDEGTDDDQKARIQDAIQDLDARIAGYFKRYGQKWSNAYYASHIRSGRSSLILDEAVQRKEHVTAFLHSNPLFYKIGWMNEVLTSKRFGEAGRMLVNVATSTETNLWSRKVELSLAKLALLSVKEGTEDMQKSDLKEGLQASSEELELVGIQEQLYNHVKPTLFGALDQAAELRLVTERFGKSVTQDQPTLNRLLGLGFESLLQHKVMTVDQLIDILTLMDPESSEAPEGDIHGREFVMAMQALKVSEVANFDATPKLIWKRCYVRDNWEELNNTLLQAKGTDKEETIQATALFATLREGMASYLWESPSKIRLCPPTQVLGAGCSAEDLKRFPSETLRGPIIEDNDLDDNVLEDFLSKAQLGHWYETCLAEAKKSIQHEAEHAAESGGKQRVLEEKFVKGAALRAGGHASEMGDVNGISHVDEDGRGEADVEQSQNEVMSENGYADMG